jgi:hypothetical protein
MGKLIESADGGLVVLALTPKEEAQNNISGSPSFVKPGTGGKICRWQDGRVFGPISGEALRIAVARGARVISEEPVEVFKKLTGDKGTTHEGLLLE